jgi:hypothetical protein
MRGQQETNYRLSMIPYLKNNDRGACELTSDCHSDRPALSKTLFVEGIRCQKLLWHRLNQGQEFSVPDESQQQILKEANEVGNLARKLYPEGRFVPSSSTMIGDSVQRTTQVLNGRQPLFEASFSDGRCFVRVDVLLPVGASEWEVIEVKSATKVEDDHYWDVAVQVKVLRRCGLHVSQCSVLHLNPAYVRDGDLDLAALFLKENVTERVFELQDEVERKLVEMLALVGCAPVPNVKIGSHCGGNGADQCPLRKKCWGFLPKQNVTQLTHGREKRFKLLNEGIIQLKDVPPAIKLSKNQTIQCEAAATGNVYFHQEEIEIFLNKLQFPCCFFDFESFSTAVPRFDGVCAWQAIPFQFSAHILDTPWAEPRHVEFLASGEVCDPRPKFLESLRVAIGETGSLIAYHSSFEKTVLTRCAEAFPVHGAWIKRAIERIVDLEIPFRNFSYYNPDQAGRTTLKLVMPAITGHGYSGLAINRGDIASQKFMRMAFEDVPAHERQKLRRDLLAYCAVDSGGMVQIFNVLMVLTAKSAFPS